MSCLIVRVPFPAHAAPMTWEEDPIVERLQQLFRSHVAPNARPDNEAQRRRSNRMRYFLNVFGSQHWSERVDRRRIPTHRGNIAL